MGRAEYAACVGKGLKGKQLGKEERKLEFCTLSKLCSGKAKTREEAETICEQIAKTPKPFRPKGRKIKRGESCEKAVHRVAECVVSKLVDDEVYRDQALNINSVGAAVINALIECECQK